MFQKSFLSIILTVIVAIIIGAACLSQFLRRPETAIIPVPETEQSSETVTVSETATEIQVFTTPPETYAETSAEETTVFSTVAPDTSATETTQPETTKKNLFSRTKKDETRASSTTVTEVVTQLITTTAKVVSDYPYSYAGFNPQIAKTDIADWTLILVNRDYILPEDYEPKLAPSVTSDPDSKKLDARVAPHYNEMYLAAKKDGIDLYPLSGYRSYSRQKENFDNKINKYIDMGYSKVEATQKAATIILPPGTSEHNAALAMDICSLEESFENSEEFRWLCEHAEDYGFILRYPKGKENITEIIYEPWHWRYVGVQHAKEINARGITLEEYLGVK